MGFELGKGRWGRFGCERYGENIRGGAYKALDIDET